VGAPTPALLAEIQRGPYKHRRHTNQIQLHTPNIQYTIVKQENNKLNYLDNH
jgi:hypothetical protein